MSLLNVDGYVLHKTPLSNGAVKLVIWSQQEGVVQALANKSVVHRNAINALQSFYLYHFSLQSHPSGFFMQSISLYQARFKLQHIGLYIGLYLNELAYYLLLNKTANSTLYALYENLLEQLNKPVFDYDEIALWLRVYERHVLKEVGLSADLNYDVLHKPIRPQASYTFDATNGFIEYTSSEQNQRDFLMSGELILKLGMGNIDAQSLKLWKYLNQCMLRAALKYKKLHSLQLIRQYYEEFKNA